MRVPWFNWRSSVRSDETRAVCASRGRADDEVWLALRLIPLYQVSLRLDDPATPGRLWWPLTWRVTLAAMVGVERAERILREAWVTGMAVIAVCPLEVAEHYRDELARYALPCAILPA